MGDITLSFAGGRTGLTEEALDRRVREAAPLLAAADELVRTALALGGTVSGEHGIGTAKRGWLDLELSPASRDLQHRLKTAFDPHQLLNPGKAL